MTLWCEINVIVLCNASNLIEFPTYVDTFLKHQSYRMFLISGLAKFYGLFHMSLNTRIEMNWRKKKLLHTREFLLRNSRRSNQFTHFSPIFIESSPISSDMQNFTPPQLLSCSYFGSPSAFSRNIAFACCLFSTSST